MNIGNKRDWKWNALLETERAPRGLSDRMRDVEGTDRKDPSSGPGLGAGGEDQMQRGGRKL